MPWRPDEQLGMVVMFVDVVDDGHDQVESTATTERPYARVALELDSA